MVCAVLFLYHYIDTQKILDALSANRIAELEGKINALQLQAAVAGVVRYPTTFAYDAGTNPFCSGTTAGA